MKRLKQKPIIVFLILSTIVTSCLIFIPLNIFPGEFHMEQSYGGQTIEAPLNLGNLVGLHIPEDELEGIQSYNLTPQGYMLAFIFCIGIPALLAYRIYNKKTLAKDLTIDNE